MKLGSKHSLDSIERMRIVKSGINNPNYGKPRNEITKNKTRASLNGHSISQTTRDKISESISKKIPELSEKLKKAWADPNTREKHMSIFSDEQYINRIKNIRKNTWADPEYRKKRSGKNAFGWMGGISFEPYCEKFNSEFKNRVRAFFGYVCLECGTPQNGTKLNVHHVNYNKKTCCNDETPMFVPLCKSCHAKTNSNREFWKQHFTYLITNYYEGKSYFTQEEFVEIQNAL